MKKVGFAVFVSLLILSIFLSQVRLVNHPIVDNDEGIYLTSFLLIDRGHPAYKETFFSQPPGFLLTAYPGFALLGKSLQAARLTVGLWSIVGLLAIVWIGIELGNKWIGILTIGILYLMRYYTNEALTFQSDIIVTTFSLLSLASLLRFSKYPKLGWFIAASFFVNFAFWTKFDVTFAPAFVIALLYLIRPHLSFPRKRESLLRLLLIFLASSAVFFVVFVVPFGIEGVFRDSIVYRFQATASSSASFSLFNFLKKDIVLFVVFISSIFLSLFNEEGFNYPINILMAWTFFSVVFFFFYRPLFAHHLAILSVPVALLFSYSVYLWMKSKKKLFIGAIFLVLAVAAFNRVNLILKTPSQVLNKEQQQAVDTILKNTEANDVVVSDEMILTAVSGRLPPPELSDMSYVRIYSNNLSPDKFRETINRYKPKLIVSWNGRLRTMKNFDDVIKDYKKLISFKKSHDVFILKNQ